MTTVRRAYVRHAILLGLITAAVCPCAHGKIIYVDDNASGANDGTGWANAYICLQDALIDAAAAEKPVEIRVAQGTYRPDQGAGQTPGDRGATFQLLNGVTIVGGYAGFGELDPNARDIWAYATVLSGDLAGDDAEVQDPAHLQDEVTRAENSCHVVTGSGTDPTAVLEGFTIVGGNADDPLLNLEGGGLYNDSGSPTIADCVITGNSASAGAGMSNDWSSNPTVTRCTFIRNSATNGGGMGNAHNSNPAVTNCLFVGNWAGSSTGGGLYAGKGSNVTITNCTFSGNTADVGAAIQCDYCAPEVVNTILWDNWPDEIGLNNGSVTVSYCDVQGGWPGAGNIDVDPRFAGPSYWADVDDPGIVVEPGDSNAVWIDGDYHLKSEAGRWDPISSSWVIDDATSPCIDAGDPNSPIADEPEPNGDIINMGAYGGTAEASMSEQIDNTDRLRIAYIYCFDTAAFESFESLLESNGTSVTSLYIDDLEEVPLSDYDLIIAGEDATACAFDTYQKVAMIRDSGKPVIGIGGGGYSVFGFLGMSIGDPHGWRGFENSIYVVDPDNSLLNTPYLIDVPQDRTLQLYTQTMHVGIYQEPAITEAVIGLGREIDDIRHYPLIFERDRYLLWGFTESPDKMTEVGRRLFVNVVVWMSNAGWDFIDETANGSDDIWWIDEGADYPRLWWE